MKNGLIVKAVFLSMASVMAGASVAGSVTIPNTFTAGTTAVADEVNQNFSAVAGAVNGNATDIATKQTRVTGSCAVNSAINSISANGDVTCEQIDKSTSVIVSAHAFSSGMEDICQMGRYNNSSYFRTSSTYASCYAVAPVELPSDATLTGLSCVVLDNNGVAGTIPAISLIRSSFLNASTQVIYTTGVATVDSTLPQGVWDTVLNTLGTDLVDNDAYYYSITYVPMADTTTVGTNARIYSCKVAYTQP